ncbi:MAG: alpha/beta hydrolase, partial [Reyranella sp.]
MPTAAGAKTAKRPKRQSPRKSAVAPASTSTAMRPLVQARSQLVGFNASAFPYRGFLPGTTKPFLDARDGRKRGHTSLRGEVFWETTTYSDRRSLLYLPPGFDA